MIIKIKRKIKSMSDLRIKIAQKVEKAIKYNLTYFYKYIPDWIDTYDVADRLLDYIPQVIEDLWKEKGGDA